MDQFEERAEVFGGGGDGEFFAGLAEAGVEADALAGDRLRQFGGGEAAQTDGLHGLVIDGDAGRVGHRGEAASAAADGREEHLAVVEVGLLEIDAGTVGQGPFGVAEVGLTLALDLAGLGQAGH